MSNEVIHKKLDQIKELVDDLETLLAKPFAEFVGDRVVMRAAERNFQLIVDLASDINAHILIARGRPVPDTYRDSFSALGRERALSRALTEQLTASARVRNILVHEYDLEEDPKKFFSSVKKFISPYREYLRIIHQYAQKHKLE